jgi:hypothetical protein
MNPDKCDFGMQQIEFVGHLIDSEGMRFSNKKLIGIREVKLPRSKKELKSFLGLANFFRDHVKGHSLLSHPLSAMLEGYTKRTRQQMVPWTTETIESFEKLKMAVNNCQKLYFLDYSNEIYLQTDASDYGAGAYLFQKTPEGHHPVMFLSKSFNIKHKMTSDARMGHTVIQNICID